jgi:hypothetical protein
VPTVKQTKLGKYFTSQEAASFVAHNAPKTLFLDIRTPAEAAFLGMAATADANVPYMMRACFSGMGQCESDVQTRDQFGFHP